MSSLSPCSSPAWHAPVCDDQSVSQRHQVVAAVVHPARQVRRVPVPDRAPEHVVGEPVDLEEVDAGHAHVALGPQVPHAALDDVPVPEVVVVDREQRGDDRVHDRQADRDDHRRSRARRSCTPGSTLDTNRTTAPFSTSTPSPSVSTVNGSAIRIRTGQTSALIRPISAAEASADAGAVDVEAGEQRAHQHERARRDDPDDQDTGDGAWARPPSEACRSPSAQTSAGAGPVAQAAVGGEAVDDQQVDAEHGERPERVARHRQECRRPR